MLNFSKTSRFRTSGIVLPLIVALCSPLVGCSKGEKDKPTKAPPESKDVPEVKTAGLDASVTTAPPKPLAEIALPWQKDLSVALSQAAKESKYLFIDFTALWCKACKELDTTTFRDPALAAMLKKDFIMVKLDVTEQTDADKALMAEFGVANLPALLATQEKAVYLQINRLVGPRDLLSHLEKLPPISGEIKEP